VNRSDLEHLIRAAGVIADCRTVIVIGSQSILGRHPDAPEEVLKSMEADIIPFEHPERADLISGTIGELSSFHDSFGYYADGVEEATAVLPDGWKDRLVPVENSNTNGIRGLCLDPHDMVIAKLIAGRDKDYAVCSILIGRKIVSSDTLLERLATCHIDLDSAHRVKTKIGQFTCPVKPRPRF